MYTNNLWAETSPTVEIGCDHMTLDIHEGICLEHAQMCDGMD